MRLEFFHSKSGISIVDIIYKKKPPSRKIVEKYHMKGYMVRVIKEGADLADYVMDWDS